MAIAQTSFLPKLFFSSIISISSLLGIGSVLSRAEAETPTILTDSTVLSVDFAECKSRAITAGNAFLKKVEISEDKDSRLKITGVTNETVAIIYCLERPNGTIAIITTSTHQKQSNNEASTLYNRLINLVTKGLVS